MAKSKPSAPAPVDEAPEPVAPVDVFDQGAEAPAAPEVAVPEPEVVEPVHKNVDRETIVVDKLGLYKLMISMMQEKPNYFGPGARRGLKELFRDADQESLNALWEEIKSHFYGGPKYHLVAGE